MILSLKTGVSEEERSRLQKVRLDGRIHLDPSRTQGGVTDRIEDTVDYARLADTLKEAAQTVSPHLLERLGHHLGKTLLAQFPAIWSGSLTLTKDPAPLDRHPETVVSVTITFTKEGSD